MGVAAWSLQQRQRSDLNLSSSERRWNPRAADHHRREGDLVAFNEGVGKDGAIYEKAAEELSLQGKKTCGQQNKEYVSVFEIVNS